MSESYERKSHDMLRSLTDCMVADVSALSDDELLVEMREDDADHDLAIRSLRAGILERTTGIKKRRLSEAKKSLRDASTRVLSSIPRPSIDVIKSKITELLSGPRGQELAISFRNGTKQSDSDLETLWDDLVEMGLVDRNDVGS